MEGATGINFVSSGTGSLTNDINHVGASAAGVYHIALAKADLSDASQAWYDEYIVILSATGAAFETMIIEGVRTDTSYISNLLSNLSAIASDIYSAMLLTQSSSSDAASAATQGNSRILLVQSRLSDLDSRLTSEVSDILSGVRGNSDALSDVLSRINSASFLSDIASHVWAAKYTANSAASSFGSLMSDIYSRAGGAVTVSDISDIASAVWATALATKLVTLNTSDMSDLRSAISAGPAGVVTASDISDIASAVWAAKYTVHSAASSFGSLFSDVYSRLVLVQSSASDAASAAQQANSRVLLNQSRISDIASFLVVMSGVQSDIYSLLSDTFSTMNSQFAVVSNYLSNASNYLSNLSQFASDIDSALTSQFTYLSGAISDIRSGTQVLQSGFIGHTGSTASTVADASVMEIDGIDHNDQFNGYYVKLLGGSQVDELRLIVDTVLSSSQIVVKPAFNSRLLSGVDFVIVAGNPFQSRIHSDIVSTITSAASDVKSAVLLTQSLASDAHSAATQASSRALVIQSQTSDIYSLLSDVGSDITVMSGVLSDTYSAVSDLRSYVLGGVTLTAAGAQAVADSVLNRNIATGGSGGARRVQNALRALRNRTRITGGVLQVFQEDDLTVAWSAAVSTAAGNPIVQIDP